MDKILFEKKYILSVLHFIRTCYIFFFFQQRPKQMFLSIQTQLDTRDASKSIFLWHFIHDKDKINLRAKST